ncbi:MAG: LacI family DNA-binding transcriptional regulator [Mobilicoccus sp.]|nr:LacI family DNA-binding transcriptional regulator [Mobilicoccus sp.]
MGTTLKDVAREAGVSAATASRALDPAAPVSPATRARVLRVVDALGYTGNASARSLRTRRTDTIGLLIPDVRNPFFTDLAYAVDKAATTHGYTVMTGNADEDGDAQDRYLRALDRHQVDGLLVVPQGGATDALRRAVERRPTVCLDRDTGLGTPVVTSDSRGGMIALVDHIVALGHRRVAIVSGPLAASTGRERLAAARERFADHDVELREDDILEGDFQLDSGIAAAEHLLSRPELPDVIIAADALMALGVLTVLRRHGVRLGEDVGLAAFDDNPAFLLLETPVTVVAQDTTQMGHLAVDALLALITGQSVDIDPVPTTLIPRRSLGERGPSDEPSADVTNEQEVAR